MSRYDVLSKKFTDDYAAFCKRKARCAESLSSLHRELASYFGTSEKSFIFSHPDDEKQSSTMEGNLMPDDGGRWSTDLTVVFATKEVWSKFKYRISLTPIENGPMVIEILDGRYMAKDAEALKELCELIENDLEVQIQQGLANSGPNRENGRRES